MSTVVGVLLIVIGVVVLVFGGRKLNVKEGIILKLLTHSQTNARLIQWGFGLAAIYLGIGLILGWFE